VVRFEAFCLTHVIVVHVINNVMSWCFAAAHRSSKSQAVQCWNRAE